MRLILAAALAAMAATPALAKADLTEAATTLSTIEKDQAKRKTYCEMQDLLVKAEAAAAKKDEAQAKALAAQAEAKSKELGDGFIAIMATEEIDPKTDDAKAFFQALEALEKSCAKA